MDSALFESYPSSAPHGLVRGVQRAILRQASGAVLSLPIRAARTCDGLPRPDWAERWKESLGTNSPQTPAKAGVQGRTLASGTGRKCRPWIPAYAGITGEMRRSESSRKSSFTPISRPIQLRSAPGQQLHQPFHAHAGRSARRLPVCRNASGKCRVNSFA